MQRRRVKKLELELGFRVLALERKARVVIFFGFGVIEWESWIWVVEFIAYHE